MYSSFRGFCGQVLGQLFVFILRIITWFIYPFFGFIHLSLIWFSSTVYLYCSLIVRLGGGIRSTVSLIYQSQSNTSSGHDNYCIHNQWICLFIITTKPLWKFLYNKAYIIPLYFFLIFFRTKTYLLPTGLILLGVWAIGPKLYDKWIQLWLNCLLPFYPIVSLSTFRDRLRSKILINLQDFCCKIICKDIIHHYFRLILINSNITWIYG